MITEDGRKNANLHILPKGTLLIAITGLEAAGTRGSCAILGIKATTNQSCMALIPNTEKVTRDFLYNWYLKIGQEYGIKYTQGTKQQSYNIDILKKLPIKIPQSIEEQNKITELLTLIEQRIKFMEKKYKMFNYYKRAFIQSLPLTCKEDLKISKWSFIPLNDCMYEHKTKSTGHEEVYSVSVYEGLINQIEHLGRSYSAEDTSKYNLVKPGDIVYTKSPTGNFPLGIIKQSHLNKNVIVSPLYGVFTPTSYELGYILEAFFESSIQCNNYLHPLVQKGAKNTMNINNKTFLSKKIHVPVDINEQKRIFEVIKVINEKLELIKYELLLNNAFKKSLLSKMFC